MESLKLKASMINILLLARPPPHHLKIKYIAQTQLQLEEKKLSHKVLNTLYTHT